VLRTLNAQPTLWEAILPEMCLGMPAELEAVDRLLDDPAFFEPFGPTSTPRWDARRCPSRPTCG
jgi:IS5 family transposase